MEYIKIIIEKEELEARIIEEKDTSVIVFIPYRYSCYIDENEVRYGKKPIIYFILLFLKIRV